MFLYTVEIHQIMMIENSEVLNSLPDDGLEDCVCYVRPDNWFYQTNLLRI